jgi:hypothetical protein
MKMVYTLGYAHLRADLWAGMEPVNTMVVASNYLSRRGNMRVRGIPYDPPYLMVDSGGFYFHLKGVDYPFSYQGYVDFCHTMNPHYAVCWDYPCEPEIAGDDRSVLYRQEKCIKHALKLMSIPSTWKWVPVLQGRTLEQYTRHARMYIDSGIASSYMGIGSLCRRTKIGEIRLIAESMHAILPNTSFHLFGVKSQVFRFWTAPSWVSTADTGAWGGMFGKDRSIWKDAQVRGLSQAQFEVREALPRYRRRVEGWLERMSCG